ncbi:serine/threonine protein phosphatase [Rathayibacter sp. AY1C9]|uniref:PP2C family serine/threonine-protein phosphatase n=1 Tax=Rathayibacter sp. AY1C9 TaxID=2080541 RepID=UPI000CE71EB0|nr:PP2C family serine/threonine-protein phosphatase [Rathayibacter sp. AY1C9]PPH45109.1 serine/threonine protein phosphatase [Rathayibacter sp. AY1C9]
MSGALSTPCPNCGEPVTTGDAFCEACGTPLIVAATPSAPPVAVGGSAACVYCGGAVAEDGYCEQCGRPAPTEREHWAEAPHPLVGGVCDRGLRHPANEDAMALGAVIGADGSLRTALLVVCDGVSSTPDSDKASLAAARAALSALQAEVGGESAGADRWRALLQMATARASGAIDAAVPEKRSNPPSCTFTAAVLDGALLVTGNVGDSRSYWMPDAGEPRQLTVDDSWAQEQIASGVPREQAETAPDAHAITRWLGADAHDEEPRVASEELTEPGWVLVCSDGLWNYASAAEDLARVLREAQERVGADPVTLAEALVAWANERGGHDNITAALARFDPAGAAETAAEASAAEVNGEETGTAEQDTADAGAADLGAADPGAADPGAADPSAADPAASSPDAATPSPDADADASRPTD